ncbi:uncharacterized protein LOC134192558 [Corticium candelabrum]|uniref:uncharacterized protein LOC134192558 n=1 Tax=Corticium candelabrum TaxID=121492 RepID=UPI002E2555C1|nr:uncharacterized protein LOC134192558 [Corticium candelabrum]
MSLTSAFPDVPGLQQAYWKQQQRIKNDELMETRNQTIKETNATNLAAKWRETLDETAAHRRLKRQNNEMAEEFHLSCKEMMAVLFVNCQLSSFCSILSLKAFESNALVFYVAFTKMM